MKKILIFTIYIFLGFTIACGNDGHENKQIDPLSIDQPPSDREEQFEKDPTIDNFPQENPAPSDHSLDSQPTTKATHDQPPSDREEQFEKDPTIDNFPQENPAPSDHSLDSQPTTKATHSLQIGKKFSDCEGCPEMVVVNSGMFLRQIMDTKIFEPFQHVTIEQPFAVGVYEVTKGEFSNFVEEINHPMGNQCWLYNNSYQLRSSYGKSWRDPGYHQTERHPVVCVSWADAKAYVKWLSHKTGEKYRLLSESEWEYVARSGIEGSYLFGDSLTMDQANYGRSTTLPVGSFRKNYFGLYDVHGNVWEWVEDCWSGDYRTGPSKGSPSDGTAWTEGDCSLRVVRGGSFVESDVKNLVLSIRGENRLDIRTNFNGFRVARDIFSSRKNE